LRDTSSLNSALAICLFRKLSNPFANSSNDIAFGDVIVESGLDGGAERFEFGLMLFVVVSHGRMCLPPDVGIAFHDLIGIPFGSEKLLHL